MNQHLAIWPFLGLVEKQSCITHEVGQLRPSQLSWACILELCQAWQQVVLRSFNVNLQPHGRWQFQLHSEPVLRSKLCHSFWGVSTWRIPNIYPSHMTQSSGWTFSAILGAHGRTTTLTEGFIGFWDQHNMNKIHHHQSTIINTLRLCAWHK